MSNRARAKGTEGELGVHDFLGRWYPGAEEDGEGYPWERIPSKGSNDIGDVVGPFTSIEAKNYTNPPVSGLLDNAEWKGGNSKKPYWFLVYKKRGYSRANSGNWHALTTLGEFTRGFGVLPDDDRWPTADDLIAAAPERCAAQVYHDCKIPPPAPRRSTPEHPWTPRMIFIPRMSGVADWRSQMLEENGHLDGCNINDRILPFTVSPRRDQNGIRPPEDWYVYGDLHDYCRLLETIGVLPPRTSWQLAEAGASSPLAPV